MAGNKVYVQGNYVDVHDNEVVNLNIDKAEVSMSDGRCQMEDAESRAKVLTSNKQFLTIMTKAVEQELCMQRGWQYKWVNRGDSAYFASVASHKFELSKRHDRDGDLAISWKPFEALFDEKNLRSIFNDWQNGKYSLENKRKIDKLLR